MARALKTREEEGELEGLVDENRDFDSLLSADEEAINEMMDITKGGHSYIYRVYKVRGSSRDDLEILFPFSPSDYSYDALVACLQRPPYGPGKYRLRLYIDGKMRTNDPLTVGAPPVAPVQAGGLGDVGTLTGFFEKMSESMDKKFETYMQLMKPQQGGGGDMVKAMMIGMGMAKDMALALKGDGAQAGNPLVNLRETIALIDDLRGETEPQDEETVATAGFKALAPLVSGLLSKWLGVPAGQPLPDIEVSGRVTLPIQEQPMRSTAHHAPADPVAVMLATLKPQIGQLVAAANFGISPDAVAEQIADKLDALASEGKLPPKFDAVAVFSDPELTTALAQAYPETGPHKAWFDKVRLAVLECYEPDASIVDPPAEPQHVDGEGGGLPADGEHTGPA